jgi:hypothetical protein
VWSGYLSDERDLQVLEEHFDVLRTVRCAPRAEGLGLRVEDLGLRAEGVGLRA